MSEIDTMFNERDRRCAAVQLMLSTDPSYDNMTIASALKMQIRTVQRALGDENEVSGYGYGLWCGFKWGPHHATSHLQSRLESQHQSVPGCVEECDDPLVQSGDRWQTLGVAAGLGAGPQVQRDPGLTSEGVLRLCTHLSLPPPPSTWTRWTTSFDHTSRTSQTWPLTTPKLAWSPSSAEYSPSSRQRLWKRHAPSSGSVSRCLSNSGTYTELRTTSFIESTGVVCSDSVSHNRVQVLSIPVLLLTYSQDWTCNFLRLSP